jgi:DNA invertase Pin-like site-specific DNA recombinase
MSAKHSTNDWLIPAAAYYRMSDDDQENSIARQRSQVVPFAARMGYRIVREYIDEGIAGDEEAKRKGFMAMLRDAQARRDFQVILCDDKDRFGRFDSITQGYYLKPLRDLGIKLVTVAQGVVDWHSFAGRITDAVLQEAKKLESQATSRRVITLMVMLAHKGRWLGGVPPYGYKVVADELLGKRMVPGDPAKVRVVQLIFRLYGEKGHSLDMIAAELYQRGVLNPRGGQFWDKTTIRGILRNRKYIGDMVWNAGHEGKYSELVAGQVRTSDARLPKRAINPAEDWVVVPGTHEPLIERNLFERVQARLADNRGRTTPLPKGGDYLLAGLLVCGRCGWRMTGHRNAGRRYYRCTRYTHEGKHACGGHYIPENKVFRAVVRKLQVEVFNPENLKRLREETRRQEQEAARERPRRYDDLAARLADLDREIEAGGMRLLKIPEDLVADVAAQLRRMKDERARVAAELDRLDGKAGPAVDLAEIVEGVEKKLWNLREALESGDPVEVRAVLREFVSRIELHFRPVQKAKIKRSQFQKGLIVLEQQDANGLVSLLSGASPTPGGSGARR